MISKSGFQVPAAELAAVRSWLDTFAAAPVEVRCVKQGWGELKFGRGIENNPLSPGGVFCEWGFGSHADSVIELTTAEPVVAFRALAGIDHNAGSTMGATGAVPALPKLTFRVKDAEGRVLAEQGGMDYHSKPWACDVTFAPTTHLTLEITADVTGLAHGDWGQAELQTAGGKWIRLGRAGASCAGLPVDFQYDGQSAAEFFSRWGVRITQRKLAEYTLHEYCSGGAAAGIELKLSVKEFHDLPVLEWQVEIGNPGTAVSGRLRDVRSLAMSMSAGNEVIVHRAKGSFHQGWGPAAFRKSFFPVTQSIGNGDVLVATGIEGRPSVDWMPYCNIEDPQGQSMLYGIGWSGQWRSEIARHSGTVTITGGIEAIDTVLEPGEWLRLPSAFVIFYSGEAQRGHNLLRRYLREHVVVREQGRPTEQLPIFNLTWGGMFEAEHLKRIANIRARQMPIECYWIDAGWYGPEGTISPDEFDSAWGSNAGRWQCNPTILPNDLTKISQAAHDAGMTQLLWCEPERAICGTPVTQEHPEWFIAVGERTAGQNLLLNLGDPAAWQWCFDTIAGLIEKNNLDWYRQDFNFGPEPYWRQLDRPGRTGIAEIRYVNGLYRLWSELLRRFPGLKIDNCASGGRRLEFELMRYSVPLWASDMQCFPDNQADWNQHHMAGLSHWLPIFSFGLQNQAGGDTYNFRSVAGCGVVVHYFTYERTPVSDAYPHDWLKHNLEELKSYRQFHCGDYYLLSDFSDSGKGWMIMQFDRPDLGGGVLKVFRSAESVYDHAAIRLEELDPAADYEVRDADDGVLGTWKGAALMAEGIAIALPQPRSSRVITYQKH